MSRFATDSFFVCLTWLKPLREELATPIANQKGVLTNKTSLLVVANKRGILSPTVEPDGCFA
jgi:hypothetical protein